MKVTRRVTLVEQDSLPFRVTWIYLQFLCGSRS